jgi:hypothetical protein
MVCARRILNLTCTKEVGTAKQNVNKKSKTNNSVQTTTLMSQFTTLNKDSNNSIGRRIRSTKSKKMLVSKIGARQKGHPDTLRLVGAVSVPLCKEKKQRDEAPHLYLYRVLLRNSKTFKISKSKEAKVKLRCCGGS